MVVAKALRHFLIGRIGLCTCVYVIANYCSLQTINYQFTDDYEKLIVVVMARCCVSLGCVSGVS